MQLFIKIILFQKKYVCALPCVAILVGLRLYLVQSLQSVSATKKQKANQIGSQKLLFLEIAAFAQYNFRIILNPTFCFIFQLFQMDRNREVFYKGERDGVGSIVILTKLTFSHITHTHNSFFTAQNPQHPFTLTFNCEKFVVSCVM